MVLHCLSLVTLEFLRLALCYSSRALASSSHSFLHNSQGCVHHSPGCVGNRMKGTNSWRPGCSLHTRGCHCRMARAAPNTPSLIHTVRSKMDKHFSLSSAAAAREQLKEASSGEQLPHKHPPRGFSGRAGTPALGTSLGNGFPMEQQGRTCHKTRLLPQNELLLPSRGPGSDAAAQKLPSSPQRPGV